MTDMIIDQNIHLPPGLLAEVLSRPDGRPEAYDIPPGTQVKCEISGVDGTEGQVVMLSPVDCSDGRPHFIATQYLPDNVVIFNPASNKCRNKAGDHEWEEK